MSSNQNENTIVDLRGLLFDTIRGVKEGKIDIDKAKVVSELAQVVVNSAKAEVDAIRATGGTGSGFIPDRLPAPKRPALTGTTEPKIPGISHPAPGVTRHICK